MIELYAFIHILLISYYLMMIVVIIYLFIEHQ